MSLVQIAEAFERLFKHVFNDSFLVGFVQRLYIAGDCIVHQLHEDPQPLLVVIGLYDSKNSLVLFAAAHYSNFVYDCLSLIIVFGLHKLESTDKSVLFPFNLENLGKSALSELANNVVVFRGISLLDLCVLFKFV